MKRTVIWGELIMRKHRGILLLLTSLILTIIFPFTSVRINAEVIVGPDGNQYQISANGASLDKWNAGNSGAITIPDTITYNGQRYNVWKINNAAFYNPTIPDEYIGITSVTIGKNVQTIESRAFDSCKGLKSVSFKSGSVCKTIENDAFAECSALTTVQLPSGLQTIGSSAFLQCSSLTTINIPDSVTEIGYSAFLQCSSLASVTLPASLTTLGFLTTGVFEQCTSLKTVDMSRCTSLTSIPENTFSGCTALTTVTFAEGLVTIGINAFHGCSLLNNITLPRTIAQIGKSAFSGCSSLKNVTILAMTAPSITYDRAKTANNSFATSIRFTVPTGAGGYTESPWSRYTKITYSDDLLPTTPTPSVSPVPTVSNTPKPTASNTPKPTASNTPKPTASNTPKPTASNTPKPTASNTPKPTASNTPKPTASNTPKPTASNTPKPTASNTPKPTASNTPKPTASNTPKPTASNTPKPTASNTPKPTASNTPKPTASNTPKPTASNTPKPTASNTPVPTTRPGSGQQQSTSTPSPSPTSGRRPSATTTPSPKPVTSRPTRHATATPSPTWHPTSTPTRKPTATQKPTSTPTPGPSTGSTQQNSQAPGVADFVERLYTVALGRPSDPYGKNDWVNRVKTEGYTGADLARGFLFSGEFLGKNMNNSDFMDTLYLTFFNRPADSQKSNWLGLMSAGWTKKQVIDGFINSTEWANLCLTYGIASGTTCPPNIEVEPSAEVIEFARRLYTTCLGRDADPAGLNSWARDIANMRISGSAAAHGFFFSGEFINAGYSDAEFVTRLYRTFMGRDPDQGGFDAWMRAIASGQSREDVFRGFASSAEFAAICADYGILR